MNLCIACKYQQNTPNENGISPKYFFSDENSVDIRPTIVLPLIAASPTQFGFPLSHLPQSVSTEQDRSKNTHNTEPGSAKGQQQKWRQPTGAALDAGAGGRGPPGGGEFSTDPSRSVLRADWEGGGRTLFFSSTIAQFGLSPSRPHPLLRKTPPGRPPLWWTLPSHEHVATRVCFLFVKLFYATIYDCFAILSHDFTTALFIPSRMIFFSTAVQYFQDESIH